MDIVRLKGGLGNQMFQYAFAESLRSKGRRVRCNLGYYKKTPHSGNFMLDRVFNNIDLDEIDDEYFDRIDREWRTIRDNRKMVERFVNDIPNRFFWVENDEEEGNYVPNVYETKSCTFVGYWQTYKYFEDIRESLLHAFRFQEEMGDLNEYRGIIKDTRRSVSVHVRRGDYLLNEDIFGGICTSEYYEKAMNYFKEKMDTPTFIFFSDDIDWVESHFHVDNSIYISADDFSKYESWYDMYLMTLCRGNIIANSTFSWWGAWLNKHDDKIVVAPSKWSNTRKMPDICPVDWIRI